MDGGACFICIYRDSFLRLQGQNPVTKLVIKSKESKGVQTQEGKDSYQNLSIHGALCVSVNFHDISKHVHSCTYTHMHTHSPPFIK